MFREIYLLNPYDIYPTEQVITDNVTLVKNKILEDGVWTTPIAVERDHFTLMDGHHRLKTAKELGLMYIPALLLNYQEVTVKSWRSRMKVTPEEIIKRGLRGHLYPPKTSQHLFPATYECALSLNSLALANVA